MDHALVFALHLAQQMAPPQGWAPNQRIAAQPPPSVFLLDSLFVYILPFPFSQFFLAVFAVLALDELPGDRVAASESFQSTHLSIKALFVGVGVRTSLSLVLPPPCESIRKNSWMERLKTG